MNRLQASGSRLQALCFGLPRAALLVLLRGYKWALSPILPPACRYVPTCSEYAAEAVDRYGVFRGLAMAMWRVLRCHPFVRGGFDPVQWAASDTQMLNSRYDSGASFRRTAGGGRPEMDMENN
jgi:putative membrane protein insertion efficiency factor